MNKHTREAISDTLCLSKALGEARHKGMSDDRIHQSLINTSSVAGEIFAPEREAVLMYFTNYWEADGHPVLSLDLSQARVLAERTPPDGYRRFSTRTMLLDIGDEACAHVVCYSTGIVHAFTTTPGGSPVPFLGSGAPTFNLVGNLAYFLAHPEAIPANWTFRRASPLTSHQQKRIKRGHKVEAAGVRLWVMGRTRNFTDEALERGERTAGKAWSWGVRTWRSEHYHWYQCGPAKSQWRLRFLDGQMIGNPDAPLSVHARRLG